MADKDKKIEPKDLIPGLKGLAKSLREQGKVTDEAVQTLRDLNNAYEAGDEEK
jgi:hypothetical protein